MKSVVDKFIRLLFGRSPCGERGLKLHGGGHLERGVRRSPCGERGLKYHSFRGYTAPPGSRSPCGERGLKLPGVCITPVIFCRSPCGERGLKLPCVPAARQSSGRSPCGERGLKYAFHSSICQASISRSPCGERGLKSTAPAVCCPPEGSLPVRGAWIEIRRLKLYPCKFASLPVRGAWIEMPLLYGRWERIVVAPRAGSVD